MNRSTLPDNFSNTMYAVEYVKNISVASSPKLTYLVLKENACVCNNTCYRQVIGGGSDGKINAMRSMAGKSTNDWLIFLCVFIQTHKHIDDILSTSNEPCLLHFLSDHPRDVFSNVTRTILVRAIRHSSTYELFN